jgi:hypothetical protein
MAIALCLPPSATLGGGHIGKAARQRSGTLDRFLRRKMRGEADREPQAALSAVAGRSCSGSPARFRLSLE